MREPLGTSGTCECAATAQTSFQSRFPLTSLPCAGSGERTQLNTHTTPRARHTDPDCDDATRHKSPTLRRDHSTKVLSHSCVCTRECRGGQGTASREACKHASSGEIRKAHTHTHTHTNTYTHVHTHTHTRMTDLGLIVAPRIPNSSDTSERKHC